MAMEQQVMMTICFLAVAAGSLVTCWLSMRSGVKALQDLGGD
jgi:hypothetical protein